MFNPDALKEIIEEGGIHFKEGAVSFIFTCPRCEKPDKLYIRKGDGVFCCFRCGADDVSKFKGKAEFALRELYSIPLEILRERLYGAESSLLKSHLDFKLANRWTSDEEEFGYDIVNEGLPAIPWSPDFVGPDNPAFAKGRSYLLEKRGLSDTHINEYQLKYHPKWGCVVFPVIVGGQLVGWQERAIDRDFKYTLAGFKKDQVLMFQDRLIGSPHAVLTEGPVDALKAHLCGGNVCSMGKSVSKTQLEILRTMEKVYLGLDPDASQEIDSICRALYDDVEVFLMPPPSGRKDLGECTELEVFEQFKTAKKYTGQMFLYFKR